MRRGKGSPGWMKKAWAAVAVCVILCLCPLAGASGAGVRAEGASVAQAPQGATFAEKLEGRYSCLSEDGETYHTLELFEVYGNLYGLAGAGYLSADRSVIEPYSFRAVECVPESAGDLQSRERKEGTFGLMTFSVMANAGL